MAKKRKILDILNGPIQCTNRQNKIGNANQNIVMMHIKVYMREGFCTVVVQAGKGLCLCYSCASSDKSSCLRVPIRSSLLYS